MTAASEAGFHHRPVMLIEAMQWLAPRPGGTYVDATLGGGGHGMEIVRRISPGGRFIGIDRDKTALEVASQHIRASAPPDVALSFVAGNYADLERILDELDCPVVDGVLFDLGVSSPQLDDPQRGFTYRHDAPLDMRMDPDQTLTARDLVNELSERELADIIWRYGEERWATRIARFIVERRRRAPLETTGELVEVIKAAVPAAARRQGPHPARRTFQALRIAVNDELGSLRRGLMGAINRLAYEGRAVAISFHSLEDRIVKEVFRDAARGCICPPELPVCQCHRVPTVRILTRRPVLPSPEEIESNPRARSAKLRAAEKVLPARKEE